MLHFFALLVFFQIKHFVADYPLQGVYMLGKFKDKGWILPLSAHCAVHAIMTFCISVIYVSPLISLGLALLDFAIHFAMDRIKASPKMLGRYKCISHFEYSYLNDLASGRGNNKAATEQARINLKARMKDNKYFWWALGLDQAVHHLTHYALIAIILGAMNV